jgi:hypothetical protein
MLVLAVLAAPPLFTDVAPTLPFANVNAARVLTADLNADGKPDVVVRAREAGGPGTPDRYRVFLNTTPEGGAESFVEVQATGLPTPRDGDCLVFADFENDGTPDALFTRYLDINNAKFVEPEGEPKRTAILAGNGDGTFGAAQVIERAPRGTTAAVAVADVNADGRLDIFLGNWYWNYGSDLRAFPSVLLVRNAPDMNEPWSVEVPGWGRGAASDDDPVDAEPKYDPEVDDRHRPLYGAMVAQVGDFTKVPVNGPDDGLFESGGGPVGDTGILCLAYGRRANFLWAPNRDRKRSGRERWYDVAPRVGVDGDAIRHGEYPAWLKERAKTDPRFDRQTEKPFRTHGNHFDAAVGDIDNDGDWDLFLAMITHAWAGESSDRSRFLVNQLAQTGTLKFEYDPRLCVDRIPPADAPPEQLQKWNQGDLYCDLADLDNDGRLDLVLASGDYPDPPPFDERLRVYRQREDGTFEDVTAAWGIDHVGSGQISLADVDLDGDVDILVGQSFMRFTPEMIKATTEKQGTTGPAVKLYLNRTIEQRKAVGLKPNGYTFIVTGDKGSGVNRDALGTVIKLTAMVNGKAVTQQRQLIGIGGCGGKQHSFQLHMALPAGADQADSVEVEWRVRERRVTRLDPVPPPGVVRVRATR